MIKATAVSETGKPIVLLGLSRADLERMSMDRPVRVEFESIGLPPTTVMLFTGDTEEQMLADLQGSVTVGQLVDDKTPYVNRQQEIAHRLRDKRRYIDIDWEPESDWVELVEAIMTLATETES